jgi:hypothetical protein
MAKFRLSVIDDTKPNLRVGLWESVEKVGEVLNAALPDLRCPICGTDSFAIVRDFQTRSSPQIISRVWEPGMPPVSLVSTLTIHCDDCGHFLFFAEDELLARAERKK